MASERVRSILVSKGAPFSDAELERMTDAEGWRWIYTHFPPKSRSETPEILFTGFTADQRLDLEILAERAGFDVVKSVTKNLTYLCISDRPGPAKVLKAVQQGVRLITVEQFADMIGVESEADDELDPPIPREVVEALMPELQIEFFVDGERQLGSEARADEEFRRKRLHAAYQSAAVARSAKWALAPALLIGGCVAIAGELEAAVGGLVCTYLFALFVVGVALTMRIDDQVARELRREHRRRAREDDDTKDLTGLIP